MKFILPDLNPTSSCNSLSAASYIVSLESIFLGISSSFFCLLVNNSDNFKDIFFKELSNNFDLIFIDPPFKEKKISLILSEIKNSNILKKDGLIIIHRNSEQKEVYFKEFKILEEKKYGISKIIFGIILN